MSHEKALFLCGGIMTLSVSVAMAQNGQNLQVSLKAMRVVTAEDQKETLVPAEQVKPGHVVEYQATYTNTASRSFRNLQATVPIPASLEYVPDSSKPAIAQASLDGKTFSAVPLMRKTVTANGQQKTEAVPYREYRFLRWNIGELGAKQTVVVSARARVMGGKPNSKPGAQR
jgi:uncharacterized repeat protein (TIGR01451 family)